MGCFGGPVRLEWNKEPLPQDSGKIMLLLKENTGNTYTSSFFEKFWMWESRPANVKFLFCWPYSSVCSMEYSENISQQVWDDF